MEEDIRKCPHCGHYENEGSNMMHCMDPEEFMKGNIRTIMEEKGWCFSCSAWQELYNNKKDDPRWLRIEGESWVAGPVASGFNRNMNFVGCGGREMTAIKNDGTVIRSNNWWHQGNVPECFKELMPDNARWSKRDEDKGQKFCNVL